VPNTTKLDFRSDIALLAACRELFIFK
jgi:hypothetical protein